MIKRSHIIFLLVFFYMNEHVQTELKKIFDGNF